MSELDISEFSLPNGDQIGASMPLDNGKQEKIYLAGYAANEAAITTTIMSSNGLISQPEILTLTGFSKNEFSAVTHIFREDALLFGLT